jgi:putative addiction module component (TIGR02574 family)
VLVDFAHLNMPVGESLAVFSGVAMPANAKQILKDALTLPAVERAALAEELLSSLDRPDSTIDELWSKEAEDRLAAFEAGEMKAIPAEDVFAEFEQS